MSLSGGVITMHLLTDVMTAMSLSGGVITMEDKNGRSALSQCLAVAPTKVKATLASIPVATEALADRSVASM